MFTQACRVEDAVDGKENANKLAARCALSDGVFQYSGMFCIRMVM